MMETVDKMPLVREMTLEDVSLVYEIECASFGSPWSKESFEEEIQINDKAFYLVLEYEGQVVGFGGMWLVFDEVHVTNIAISPAFRGKGLGAFLVKEMCQRVISRGFKYMTLEVRVTNSVAIALYEKLGFVSAGIRPKYYIDTGEDAMVMWKELGNE